MEWFRRKPQPPPTERKEIPDGLWTKMQFVRRNHLCQRVGESLWVCSKCSYPLSHSSRRFMAILLDEGSFQEYDAGLVSLDPFRISRLQKYPDRIAERAEKTMRTTP